MNLAMFMAIVTGIELIIIFIPFAEWFVMSAIVVLSVIKFVGVITWFMHLVYDKLFCTALFMIGLILAIGTATALLMLNNSEDYDPLEEASIRQQPSDTIAV